MYIFSYVHYWHIFFQVFLAQLFDRHWHNSSTVNYSIVLSLITSYDLFTGMYVLKRKPQRLLLFIILPFITSLIFDPKFFLRALKLVCMHHNTYVSFQRSPATTDWRPSKPRYQNSFIIINWHCPNDYFQGDTIFKELK